MIVSKKISFQTEVPSYILNRRCFLNNLLHQFLCVFKLQPKAGERIGFYAAPRHRSQLIGYQNGMHPEMFIVSTVSIPLPA